MGTTVLGCTGRRQLPGGSWTINFDLGGTPSILRPIILLPSFAMDAVANAQDFLEGGFARYANEAIAYSPIGLVFCSKIGCGGFEFFDVPDTKYGQLGALTGEVASYAAGGGGIFKVGERAAVKDVVGGFKMTETVAKHAADVVAKGPFKGELARPFLNSPLTIGEIRAAGKGIADPGGVAGALRWDVPGAFRGTQGTWELVMKDDLILHFNFVGK